MQLTSRPHARRRTIVRRVLCGALLATLVAAGGAVTWRIAGPYPSGTWASLDATDRAMFTELSAQYERSAANPGQVWTDDFHYEDQPFLLLRTRKAQSLDWQYAFLINMSDVVDTSGMRKVSLPNMPLLDDVYVSKTFGLEMPWLHLPANFTDVQFDGTSLEAFKVHAGMFDTEAASNADFRHFSAHEHFHLAVQGIDPEAIASWKYDDGGYLDSVPTSDEHERLLRAELAALDQAREATDASFARAAATDAVRLRLARQDTWPGLVKQDGIETIEGTATYFETKINGDESPTGAFSLVDVMDRFGERILDRDLYYFTGACLGETLDELRPGWKSELNASAASGDGPTLFKMLQETTGVTEAPSQNLINELVNTYS